MQWLVDSDVASQTSKARPRPEVTAWLRRHAVDCYLSQLTMAELAYGVKIAPEHRQEALDAWLAKVRAEAGNAILPLGEDVFMTWKSVLADLKRANTTLPCEDSLLAAHARALGLGVATLNRRHFEAAGCVCADFNSEES